MRKIMVWFLGEVRNASYCFYKRCVGVSQKLSVFVVELVREGV
jgi:hypothetical protein